MAKPKKRRPEDRSTDYEVGFGKPPKATQFQKGRSGNPKGRPKGARNTATVAHAVLNEKITINENGRQKVVTKREAMIKKLVNGSLQGDNSAMRLVITQLLPAVDAAQAQGAQSTDIGLDDTLILAPLLQQLGGPTTVILAPEPEPDQNPEDGSASSAHNGNQEDV